MRNNILFLIGGIILGAVPTYLYMKKQLDESIDELNDYLEYNDISDDYDKEVNPVEQGNVDSDDEIKQKLERNYEETTNYAAMYKGDAANHEHPADSDEDEDNLPEELMEEAIEMTKEHNKNKMKPPKIISESAVGDLPQYFETQTLFYYPEDDILTTEEDEEIPDIETYIGDSLTKYGFKDNDEERIYVVNYALDVCYDVQKLEGSFSG